MTGDAVCVRRAGRDVVSFMENVPTPLTRDDSRIIGATKSLDDYLVSAAREFGVPVSYKQEQNGALIHNLFPMKSTEGMQISTSSRVLLAMHTELAFHPHRPDTVLLLCVRGDSNAGTTWVDVRDVISRLGPKIIDALREPLYKTSLDASFIGPEQKDVTLLTPIIHEDGSFTYDFILMEGTDFYSRQALAKLSQTIAKMVQTTYMQTGDMLVIDNRYAIHGRTPFSPRYDGTDRWVKRILVKSNIDGIEEITLRDDQTALIATTF